MSGISYKRGAFRLWVVLSVLWCGVVTFAIGARYDIRLSAPSFDPSQPYTVESAPTLSQPRELTYEEVFRPQSVATGKPLLTVWQLAIKIAPIAAIMPLLLLALGAGLFWIAAGFRRSGD